MCRSERGATKENWSSSKNGVYSSGWATQSVPGSILFSLKNLLFKKFFIDLKFLKNSDTVTFVDN